MCKVFPLILCGFLSGVTVFAQTSRFLSLDELFSLGLENSLQIKASYIRMQMATDQEKIARDGRLPKINVGLTEGYIGTPTVFQKGLSKPVHPHTPDWMHHYDVDFLQPLYKGGKIRYGIEKAALQKKIAKLDVEQEKEDVKLILIEAYLNLFKLYKQQEVFTQNIRECERRLHDIRQMRKEGMITQNDVIRSELQLTNYQLSLRETQDDIALVSQQLDMALGLDEEIRLLPDTAVLEKVHPVGMYTDYIQQAYDQYPELQMARLQVESSRMGTRLTKADYLPSLFLKAGNTLSRPITNVSPVQDVFKNTWNISLVVSYNLSSLYTNKHHVDAIRRTIRLEQTRQEQLMQDIRLHVKSAYVKHKEALDRIEALRIYLKQANENYRIVQNKYLNQLAILTDLLDASNVRLDAELQLTAAKADELYTYFQLVHSTGNL